MSRIMLVVVCLVILVVPVHPTEPAKCKTLEECQAKVDSVYAWYDNNKDKNKIGVNDSDLRGIR